MPQVTLDGSEQRTLFSKNYIIPPPYGGSYRWYGSLAANFSWNLDFWGKQAALIERARNTAEAAALDAEAAKLALSGAFAQAYINLILNYQNGEIADATVAERAEILKDQPGPLRCGPGKCHAVEQAKSLLSIAKADQLRYAAAREMDIHAIAALAGQGAGAYETITRPNANLDVTLPLPGKASRRSVVAPSRYSGGEGAGGSRGAGTHRRACRLLSRHQSCGAGGLPGDRPLQPFHQATPSPWASGLPSICRSSTLGKLKADYARATADLDQSVADYNGAVLNAARQTADAMTQVKSLAAQRKQQQDAVTSAQRAFQIAEDRYRSGLDTQLPMLTAEATLLQARQALAGVTAQGAQQRITLLLTVGGGFEPAPAVAAKTDSPIRIAKQDIRHD